MEIPQKTEIRHGAPTTKQTRACPLKQPLSFHSLFFYKGGTRHRFDQVEGGC